MFVRKHLKSFLVGSNRKVVNLSHQAAASERESSLTTLSYFFKSSSMENKRHFSESKQVLFAKPEMMPTEYCGPAFRYVDFESIKEAIFFLQNGLCMENNMYRLSRNVRRLTQAIQEESMKDVPNRYNITRWENEIFGLEWLLNVGPKNTSIEKYVSESAASSWVGASFSPEAMLCFLSGMDNNGFVCLIAPSNDPSLKMTLAHAEYWNETRTKKPFDKEDEVFLRSTSSKSNFKTLVEYVVPGKNFVEILKSTKKDISTLGWEITFDKEGKIKTKETEINVFDWYHSKKAEASQSKQLSNR